MRKRGGGNTPSPHAERIGVRGRTRGTETSKYPQEKKENIDSVSSGERKRNSPNRDVARRPGVEEAPRGLTKTVLSTSVWKVAPQRVTVPYATRTGPR